MTLTYVREVFGAADYYNVLSIEERINISGPTFSQMLDKFRFLAGEIKQLEAIIDVSQTIINNMKCVATISEASPISSQPSKKLQRHPFQSASSSKSDNGEGASASRSKYITKQVNFLFACDSMENNLFTAIINPPQV